MTQRKGIHWDLLMQTFEKWGLELTIRGYVWSKEERETYKTLYYEMVYYRAKQETRQMGRRVGRRGQSKLLQELQEFKQHGTASTAVAEAARLHGERRNRRPGRPSPAPQETD